MKRKFLNVSSVIQKGHNISALTYDSRPVTNGDVLSYRIMYNLYFILIGLFSVSPKCFTLY